MSQLNASINLLKVIEEVLTQIKESAGGRYDHTYVHTVLSHIRIRADMALKVLNNTTVSESDRQVRIVTDKRDHLNQFLVVDYPSQADRFGPVSIKEAVQYCSDNGLEIVNAQALVGLLALGVDS